MIQFSLMQYKRIINAYFLVQLNSNNDIIRNKLIKMSSNWCALLKANLI